MISPSTYRDRLAGVVSPAFHTKQIGIIGAGGGSYLAEKLARLGPEELRIADMDEVAVENLCRTAFDTDDVGMPKVDALARHIRAANPLVNVRTFADDITELDAAQERDFIDGLDLLVAGTDSFRAQALINRWSQQGKIPAIFIGVHAGALGGRVVWSSPDQTACYRCVARDRYDAFEDGENELDLPGARGSAIDISFIDMVALKVAVAILERGQDSIMGRFFSALSTERTEIIVRTSPDYEFGTQLWDALLGDLPTHPKPFAQQLQDHALFAMDTVWLPTIRQPDCPDCGQPRNQEAAG